MTTKLSLPKEELPHYNLKNFIKQWSLFLFDILRKFDRIVNICENEKQVISHCNKQTISCIEVLMAKWL